MEGSPCGYGFVDIEQNAQTVIDLLNTSIVRNALVSSIPRFFVRQDGGINEEDFLDLSKTIIKTNGQICVIAPPAAPVITNSMMRRM